MFNRIEKYWKVLMVFFNKIKIRGGEEKKVLLFSYFKNLVSNIVWVMLYRYGKGGWSEIKLGKVVIGVLYIGEKVVLCKVFKGGYFLIVWVVRLCVLMLWIVRLCLVMLCVEKLFIVRLFVVMLFVVMLCMIMLCVVMLCVLMLFVVILYIVMLCYKISIRKVKSDLRVV